MKKINEANLPKVDNAKRKILLSTAAGAAVAGVWHKPIVNAMILPAHAQTSVLPESFFQAGNSLTTTKNDQPSFSPLDFLVPQAHAANSEANGNGNGGLAGDNSNENGAGNGNDAFMPTTADDFGLLATQETPETYMVQLLNPPAGIIYANTLNIDGTIGTLTNGMVPGCIAPVGPVDASILSVDATEIQVEIETSGGAMFTITAAAGEGTLNCDALLGT